VQRAVDRGTKIAPQVRATIHEKLPAVADSGVELDALTKLPVEQQHEAVKLCEQWRKGVLGNLPLRGCPQSRLWIELARGIFRHPFRRHE